MKRTRYALVLVVLCLAWAGGAAAKPPLWDTIKPSGRFKVLKGFNQQAVSDAETGLVWTISPGAGSTCTPPINWFSALYCCQITNAGGRLGWRLPSFQELQTLVDTSQSNPALQSGNPFTGVSGSYWTATTITSTTTEALVIGLDSYLTFAASKSGITENFWCVRAPGGFDLSN